MTICYFGIYDPEYPRNRNLLLALRQAGAKVIEVQDRSKGIQKYINLFKKHWPVRKEYDILIVGFSGQIIVPFAKLITRKPIVFDAHVSLYDSDVIERKKYKPQSARARFLYFLDWLSCRLADRVLIDTKAHARYFSELLHLSAAKIWVVYHGVDPDRYARLPHHEQGDVFLIEFHGFITKTNGFDLVLEALHTLNDPSVALWVIGGGPEYARMQKIAEEYALKSVTFFSYLPPADLRMKIASADLGLGFFNAASGRVSRVIANKVYELMSLGIPVLTADSQGMREQFTHREHVFLCEPGSAEALCSAIKELKADKELRLAMAEKAYQKIQNDLTPAQVGKRFLADLVELVEKR